MGKATTGTCPGQLKLVEDPEEPLRLVRDQLKAELRGSILHLINELFDQERRELIGEPWSRKTPGQARSGGTERGSIYLEGRRMPVSYPRVVDAAGSHAPAAYRALRSYDLMAEEVQAKLVRGVSTRDYRDVVGQVVEGTALPSSTVSRAFVRASLKSLEQINGRDLSKDLLVAIFTDGIAFGETLVVAAMGVSVEGQKILLGLQEGHTENTTVVSALLDNLVDRGLTLTDHFLAVVDGAKALKSALLKRWQGRVVIQRCQVHKKRNVLDHLPPPYHAEVKRRMSMAYAMTDEAEARKVLLNLIEWLRQANASAAESLREGMDETLTVVRLGLPEPLRRTFSTTNPLESVFDGVSSRSGRVKRWRTGRGQMVLRWAAAAGLQVESRLHRVRGHNLMNLMIEALNKIHVDERKEVG